MTREAAVSAVLYKQEVGGEAREWVPGVGDPARVAQGICAFCLCHLFYRDPSRR